MSEPIAGQRARPRRKILPPAKKGFFQQLFSYFSDTSDVERRKRRMLKIIARELKRTRSRFYQPRAGLVEAPLAHFFFELYRVVGPAHALLSQRETSGGMRYILIERLLTPEQRAIKEGFSEDAIRARLKGAVRQAAAGHAAPDAAAAGRDARGRAVDPAQVVAQTQESLKSFLARFDSALVAKINAEYRTLSVLLSLIHFDYYFLLRKFDSRLPEGAAGYQPHFEPIHIQYVLEELESFQEILQVFEPQANWEKMLEILSEYRGVELISREGFRRALRLLTEVHKSRVLEAIIRLALEDPFYRFRSRSFKDRIVEEYLSNLKLQTEAVLQKIVQENRRSQLDDLKRQVFGGTAVVQLRNYTEKANEMYARVMLGGYSHTVTLNYLRAFLVDSVRGDFRALAELLAIHARWQSTETSQAFSEAFHQLMELCEEIGRFDETLGEGQEPGSILRGLLARSDRDRRTLPLLRQHLKEINETARLLVERAGPHLIAFGRLLRQLIEDLARSRPELILNWKEVQAQAAQDLRPWMVALYKKLYSFVQLLQEARK